MSTTDLRARGSTFRLPSDSLHITNIFGITKDQLASLFDTQVSTEERLQLLQKFESNRKIVELVASDENTGIRGDERDIARRKSFFDGNQKPLPQLPPFWESLRDALNDRILMLLGVFAFLSIVTGMIYHPLNGWIEGFSIYVAIFLLVLITSFNDWRKDRQFVRLQSLARDEEVSTIRGKDNAVQTLNIWDLVVGDVVQLSAGDKVPADCLLLSGSNLTVDESVTKAMGDCSQAKSAEDPFLFADSYLKTGSCRVLVASVGKNSTRGVVDQEIDTSTKTPLEKKLFTLSKTFTYLGIWAAIAILGLSTALLLLQTSVNEEVGGTIFMKKITENITLAIIIIMVAIPEGLPVTVAISLAYSVIRIYREDKVLVHDLTSPEKMGQITELLTGKTGTLTTEDMSVVRFYTQDMEVLNSRKNTFVHCSVQDFILNLLKESIVYNTSAHIEMTENAFYKPVGNGTEVSLLKWLQDAEVDIHSYVQQRAKIIQKEVPFCSIRKRSITAVRHPNREDTIRVYIKGAPEFILENATSYYDNNAETQTLDHGGREYMQSILKPMTNQALRVMAFAFKDFTEDDFAAACEIDGGLFNSNEAISELESNSHFIGFVALKDPLRDRVPNVVQYAKKGRVSVRMISGDNLQTATAIAVDAGIIDSHVMQLDASVANQYVMDAREFSERVEGLTTYTDEDGNEISTPVNMQAFEQIIDHVKVIGRANPEDKLLITAGLQRMGRKVAVIGDGINDVQAFKAAHVSLAMGSGVSFAKNNSSMVLTNNDFESSLKAVMWGRNIYTNIKRFLQFQITINFSILITIVLGMLFLVESPFNATQLLWINLIMDTLGALALATLPPNASVIRQAPSTDNSSVLSPIIWRQIYGVTAWNVFLMFIVIYFGKLIFDLDYDGATQTTDPTPQGEAKKKHMTIIFNTFVFLCFFNQINCRVVGVRDFNVFINFFNNWTFIFIMLSIVAVQWSACNWLYFLFETTKIGEVEFYRCIVWGASVLIVSFVLKLTPEHWVEKIPIQIDENAQFGRESVLMSFYEQQALQKVIPMEREESEASSVRENEKDDDFQAA